MAINYVIAIVPAASRDAAEAAVAPYLLSPNEPGVYTFSAPLSANGTAPPTHYGCCAPVHDDGPLAAAIPALVAAFPGSAYQTVSPVDYVYATHWAGWLAARNLREVTA